MILPCDVLTSFAFHASRDLVAERKALPPGSLLWVDSGAFTAYTIGTQVDLVEYAEWLARPGWDYAFTLDVIGDPDASRANTDKLHGMGYPVVPIFHFGSPLAEFRSLVREHGYVGAGGLVSVRRRLGDTGTTRYLRTLTRIADEHGAAVHALGVGGRQVVRDAQVWSCDSSSPTIDPHFGVVSVFDGRRIRRFAASETDKLHRLAASFARYDIPIGTMLATGRWPGWEERAQMVVGCHMSHQDMWAQLRRQHPVPPPERLPAPRYATDADLTGVRGVGALVNTDWPYFQFAVGHRSWKSPLLS